MSEIKTSFKSQSFIYDFAVDGGAISSIGMGIFIPASCQLIWCMLMPVIDLVGAGALIDIGLLNGTTKEFIDNAGMGNSGTLSDYNAATWGFAPLVKGGSFMGGLIPANGAATAITVAGEVAVTISGFALTAGKFIAHVFYLEF